MVVSWHLLEAVPHLKTHASLILPSHYIQICMKRVGKTAKGPEKGAWGANPPKNTKWRKDNETELDASWAKEGGVETSPRILKMLAFEIVGEHFCELFVVEWFHLEDF